MRYLLTADDLSLWYAGQQVNGLIPWASATGTEIAKAVGAITGDMVPEWRQILYGAQVWSQLNRERNIFAFLPKTKWVKSGWRMLTSYATSSPDDIVLASETSPIPDAVRPEITTAKAYPGVVSEAFEMSLLREALINAGADDMAFSYDQLRTLYATFFMKRIDQNLGKKVLADTRTNSVDPTNEKIVPLDRIISGYEESQIGSGAGDPIGDYVDVYGLDRHTNASLLDSIVIHNGGTTSSSLLSIETLADAIMNKVVTNGGDTSILITGPDTYTKIVLLFENYANYYFRTGDPIASPITYTSVELGNEGAKPKGGITGGWTVANIFGKPILESVNVAKDGISRIYGLDLHDPEGYGIPRMHISVAMPTTYFEVRNPAIIGKPVIRGVFLSMFNTIAHRFNTQFKIRDLA